MNELEQAAARPLPQAPELAGTWPVSRNPNPVPAPKREEILTHLRFGSDYTDHMARATYSGGRWHSHRIEPYGPIPLSPAAAVLHYAQEIFEGLKAYRHEDGSVWTFRPGYNAARLNYSARRLAIPEFAEDDFLASIVNLVQADEAWVPSVPGSSLYLRPFIIATEPFLGVRQAHELEYLLIASPSGPYFKGGFTPVRVWVTRDYHRAGPGGTGAAKFGGNYAASLIPKVAASEAGYDEVCFLDAVTKENIDELGGMNVFVVRRDGTVATPELNGNILPGGTRGAIITVLNEWGIPVREEPIGLTKLVEDIRAGEVTEMFACGTAAVVTSIGHLAGTDFQVDIPGQELTGRIYQRITDIQLGNVPDDHGWTYRIC